MRILRLSRPTDVVSAEVFEEVFGEQLGAVFDVRHADGRAWWRTLLGPPGTGWDLAAAAHRLDAAVEEADFLAPSYEVALLAPLFLALRNLTASRTRLLLIAHAPGTCALEWALLGRLMAPGDRIVAPSRNAADLIERFDPALAPFVVVLPHPMAPLGPAQEAGPAPEAGPTGRLVSLGRLHPTKLLHRQIEALAVLRARGRKIPSLEIAGPAATPAAAVYLRSLKAKVCRLGLETSVRFVGVIRGRAAKARFLAGASGLVNLSVTVEESFGKAPIEALGCGVPVLATGWDGLPETVGEGGVLIPVGDPGLGMPADVSPAQVADGLQRLLDAPPSAEICRAQAARFAPSLVLPRYRAALEAAHAEGSAAQGRPRLEPPPGAARASSDRGWLAAAAPLTAMSFRQLFACYLDSCEELRRSWEPGAGGAGRVDLRGILLQGTRALVEGFLAGRAQSAPAPSDAAGETSEVVAGGVAAAAGEAPSDEAPSDEAPSDEAPCGEADDVIAEVVAAAVARPALPSTRVACLVHLWQLGRAEELATGLDHLDGFDTPAVRVLRAEEASLLGRLDEAFQRACHGLDLGSDDPVTAFRLCQMARLARAAGCPGRALARLSEWLERFPDAPDSGAVWLELGQSAAGGDGDLEQLRVAEGALHQARELLGDSPALGTIERWLAVARASAAVQGRGDA